MKKRVTIEDIFGNPRGWLNQAPWPNEDPRYPPEHPLSREKNEAARRSGAQLPKGKCHGST